MKFVSRKEWDELQLQHGNEELLNEILSRVCNKAMEDTLRKLPEVVSRMLKSTIATQNMSKDFFDRNKDFVNYPDIVNSVVQDTESKNPNASYKDILKDSESVIQSRIKTFVATKTNIIP